MASVLIVDDVPDTVRLVGMVLQADGHTTFTVETVPHAFALLRHRRVDLVIADQNMPGMTGEEFLTRVAALWPRTARLLLTADPRIRDDGSRGYPVVGKPFRPGELRAAVSKILSAAP